MPKFRKKPIVIEAVQFENSKKSFDAIWDWMGGHDGPNSGYSGPDEDHPESFTIDTLEGRMKVAPGDWVIKGVKGEFYPCRDEIFRMTYEPA